MRATINFEVDMDRVNETMMELVSTQVEYLIDAASLIGSRKSEESGNLLEALSETLERIDRETAQLRQYRDMLASFERARFETLLPQPAQVNVADTAQNMHQVKEIAATMRKFDEFVGRVNEEKPDEPGPEEG
jgi:arginine/lysine/ornithine decarboxylase